MLTCKTMLQNISKGQSGIPLRYLLAGLEGDYNELKHTIRLMYVKKEQEKVMMYYKAPSSTFQTLLYDVVFEFHGHDLIKIDTNTQFKVYCNSPSFYFRFANTFKSYGSLLYIEKYPALVNDEAKVRNPVNVSGFDKYVYSCLRLSMIDTVDNLIQKMYRNTAPEVDSFNKKRFEYVKMQKLKKISEDNIDLL